MGGNLLVDMHGVRFVYGDGTEALKGIDLGIEGGGITGIAGENGSGKTTLCKLMNALLQPTEGKVLVDGVDTSTVNTPHLARKVGYLFQNPDYQIFSSTVRGEIEFGLRNIGLADREIELRIAASLESLSLQDFAGRPPMTLSMGKRRLVSIAATLAMQQRIIILDEPTAWLDHEQSEKVVKAIRSLATRDRAILVITHDMRLMAELTGRLIVMKGGRIMEDGRTGSLLSKPYKLSEFGLSAPPISKVSAMLGRGMLPEGAFDPDIFVTALSRAKGGSTIGAR